MCCGGAAHWGRRWCARGSHRLRVVSAHRGRRCELSTCPTHGAGCPPSLQRNLGVGKARGHLPDPMLGHSDACCWRHSKPLLRRGPPRPDMSAAGRRQAGSAGLFMQALGWGMAAEVMSAVSDRSWTAGRCFLLALVMRPLICIIDVACIIVVGCGLLSQALSLSHPPVGLCFRSLRAHPRRPLVP